MTRKERLVWYMELAYTTVKYDVKSFVLVVKIAVIRMKTAIMKKATEVLRDEL